MSAPQRKSLRIMAAQEAATLKRYRRSPSMEPNEEHRSNDSDVPLIEHHRQARERESADSDVLLIKRHRQNEEHESSNSDISPPIPKKRRLCRSNTPAMPAENSSSTKELASRQSNDTKSNYDDDKKIQKEENPEGGHVPA
ncbi:uncharacterized protein BHQ10_003896 [Talaromyces amestolkiae]|uniref:Uncharacterized protein n=1 Tax=Talaromyces amestolkiae TaxID=1196081 RepID=A0A364KWF8_TALAM|nr:uncharacterized protein BHQ10_003896 [Talaromyces amestolkiae]RAO67884.1 hypothetical protein BHQ10_003896 [Talaromyces amestolkiae]